MPIFFSVLLIFLTGLILIKQVLIVEKGYVGIEKYIYLILSFFFILIPILYLLSFEGLKENSYNFWILKTILKEDNVLRASILILLGVLSIILGIKLSTKVKFREKKISKNKVNIYISFLFLMTFLSFIINIIYIVKVGGVVQAIVQANLYRAHGLMENPLGVLSKLQPFIVIGSLLLLPFRLKINYIFILFSILYLIIEASRTNFAMYFIIIFLYWLNINNKFSLIKLALPFILVILLAYMGNALTDWIEGKGFILSPTFYYSTLSQFSPAFSTILNIDDFVSWHNGYGWFYDVKSLFPEKLFGMEKTWKSWQYLTEYYLGGFWTVAIPIDLISYGYFQLSYFGVLIYSLLFGVFSGLIKNYIYTFKFSYDNDFTNFIFMFELILAMFLSSLIGWGSLDATVFYGTIKYWLFLLFFIILMNVRIK
ncbi:MAG: O-antigen ligase [Aliarcobacter sp.]|nr:O-antigen ligase [Aliarcobacter sp.]